MKDIDVGYAVKRTKTAANFPVSVDDMTLTNRYTVVFPPVFHVLNTPAT
jgi:hypothetical protein